MRLRNLVLLRIEGFFHSYFRKHLCPIRTRNLVFLPSSQGFGFDKIMIHEIFCVLQSEEIDHTYCKQEQLEPGFILILTINIEIKKPGFFTHRRRYFTYFACKQETVWQVKKSHPSNLTRYQTIC
ncbi:MAG: hypothetical protein CVU46_09720 [Chloroflexi bacterium HGW-Chloroflexi-8]|nr:MAG: hypothetical protein CVU46_09720 [Chloroflexi bacterium HGW-Chloroflexi-8]